MVSTTFCTSFWLMLIHGVQIENFELIDEGANALADTLISNSSPRCLHLVRCLISLSFSFFFARILSRLMHVLQSDSRVGDGGGCSIARFASARATAMFSFFRSVMVFHLNRFWGGRQTQGQPQSRAHLRSPYHQALPQRRRLAPSDATVSAIIIFVARGVCLSCIS